MGDFVDHIDTDHRFLQAAVRRGDDRYPSVATAHCADYCGGEPLTGIRLVARVAALERPTREYQEWLYSPEQVAARAAYARRYAVSSAEMQRATDERMAREGR